MFKVTICYLEQRARVKSHLYEEVVSSIPKRYDRVMPIEVVEQRQSIAPIPRRERSYSNHLIKP